MPDEPIRPVGKAPILRSAVTNNYSRPVRPTLPSEESPAELEDRKRRVLERNGRSNHSSPTSSYRCPSPSHFPAPPDNFQNLPLSQPGSRSPSPTETIHSPAAANPYPSPNMLSVHRPEAISLPRKPPSVRADSPASLYSTYSFYQLDNGSSSPSSPHFPPGAQSQPNPVSQPISQPPSPALNAPTKQADYLQLGITHHEANRLTESAFHASRRALRSTEAASGDAHVGSHTAAWVGVPEEREDGVQLAKKGS